MMRLIKTRYKVNHAKDLSPEFLKKMPPLPVIDWKKIESKSPQLVPTKQNKDDKLPKVDVVIITWTEAEWAAFDHVFCNSETEMPFAYYENDSWQNSWNLYGRGYEKIESELPADAPSKKNQSWGRFRIVLINNHRVLLFKSDMHITTDGPKIPLQILIENIVQECSPDLLLTIGTAGGTRTGDVLGTVNITNKAHFNLGGDFKDEKFNCNTYSNNWRPSTDLLPSLKSNLMIKIPITFDILEDLAKNIHPLKDLLDKEIEPDYVLPEYNILDIPAFTTNEYEIATNDNYYDEYACMEMDDAVIAMVCSKNNQTFGIVRNISDPVINHILHNKEIQQKWAEAIFGTFGFYTSFNGALAAWAIVAVS